MAPVATGRRKQPQEPVDESQFAENTFLWHRKRRIDAMFHSTTSAKSRKSAAAESAAAAKSTKFVESCRFFALGLCRKGSKCRYRHYEQPTLLANNNNIDNDDDDNDNENDDDDEENEEKENAVESNDATMTAAALAAPKAPRVRTLRFAEENGGAESTTASATSSSSSKQHTSEELITFAKRLTWLLRHGAGDEDVVVRADGYVRVSDVLALRLFRGLSLSELQSIVRNDDKSRMELSMIDDELFVRATQGHSLDDVVDERLLLPITDASAYPLVMHGTTMAKWDSIYAQGLSRMARRHVHLTTALPDSANSVRSGMRADCDLVIVIDMRGAMRDGALLFYLASNGVVLTPGDANGVIPSIYFTHALRRPSLRPFYRALPSVHPLLHAAPVAALSTSVVPNSTLLSSSSSSSSSASTSIARSESGVLCKLDMAGICQNGRQCRFTHDAELGAEVERIWLQARADYSCLNDDAPNCAVALQHLHTDAPRNKPTSTTSLSPSKVAATATKSPVIAPADARDFDLLGVIDVGDEKEIVEISVIVLDMRTVREVARFHRFITSRSTSSTALTCAVSLATALNELCGLVGELCGNSRSFAWCCVGDAPLGGRLAKQCATAGVRLPRLCLQWIDVVAAFNAFARQRVRTLADMMALIGRKTESGRLGMEVVIDVARVVAWLLLRGMPVQYTSWRMSENDTSTVVKRQQ